MDAVCVVAASVPRRLAEAAIRSALGSAHTNGMVWRTSPASRAPAETGFTARHDRSARVRRRGAAPAVLCVRTAGAGRANCSIFISATRRRPRTSPGQVPGQVSSSDPALTVPDAEPGIPRNGAVSVGGVACRQVVLSALHAGGRRFDPCTAHSAKKPASARLSRSRGRSQRPRPLLRFRRLCPSPARSPPLVAASPRPQESSTTSRAPNIATSAVVELSSGRVVANRKTAAQLLSARGLLLRLRLARPAGLAGDDVLLRPLCCHDIPPSPVGGRSLLMRRSRIRSSLVHRRLIRAQVEISEASLPEHRAVRSQPGDGDRKRLRQPSQTGEGRTPMPSRQPEPPDRRIVAIPADDLPRDGVGDGSPGDAQLIACRAGQPQSIRACPREPPGSEIVRRCRALLGTG
jgi:hypothetical protein